MADSRAYPQRPIVAASAAIIRDGKVLVVRRAQQPSGGLFSLPGGVVEIGETLQEAVAREVMEETSLVIEPVALAGYRETIIRDDDERVHRHFVILPFAARWISGEPVLNEELSEWQWVTVDEIATLQTTPGLAAIVQSAIMLLTPAESPQSSRPTGSIPTRRRRRPLPNAALPCFGRLAATGHGMPLRPDIRVEW
jgi:ADP-ribose pyrophosphatase YjhB (NUDIX family)